MRILFVIPGREASASMMYARRQAASIAALGHDTRTFYLRARTAPSIVAREALRLRQAVRAFDADVVHAHYGSVTALLTALVAGPLTDRPLVVTFRGSDLQPAPEVSRARSGAARAMSQLAALRADGVICVSEGLRQRLWWGRERATVLPTGVDTGRFAPRPRAQARAELGWPDDEEVVLFNGRDRAVKRYDLALAGVEVARRTRSAIRLEALAGDVDHARMATLMNAADCLLVTSAFEGSPNIVKEALACDLPVVSVDCGDVAERLAGVSPSRVVARDPAAIGAAIAEILAAGRRSDGSARVRDLDQAVIAERIVAVYARAVASATRSR